MDYLIKTGVFSLVGNYLRPSNSYRQSIFNINAVVLILIICKDLRNWLNVYLNFSFFTVFLKYRNIISKLKVKSYRLCSFNGKTPSKFFIEPDKLVGCSTEYIKKGILIQKKSFLDRYFPKLIQFNAKLVDN